MGRGARLRPKRLAKKLVRIRAALGLSQNGIVRALGFTRTLTQDYISKFERGILEPASPVLLRYARIAGVLVEVLIDDELDLPEVLPSDHRHREGVPKEGRKRQGA